MKTVLAAAFAAATLVAGAAHAAEATHGGVQVLSTAILPYEQGQNTGFAGLSVQREAGPANVVPTNDPARGAFSN